MSLTENKPLTPDEYLRQILTKQDIDRGSNSPVVKAAQILYPTLRKWAGSHLVNIYPSGSFAKGTANRLGTDIDLFISLSSGLSMGLKEIYDSLFTAMSQASFKPQRQNVSINVQVKSEGGGEYDVDLVPGKRQSSFGDDHSLWMNKAQTWKQTNIQTHIATVTQAGRQAETRIIKLWRRQKGLEFPSFYVELATIAALKGKQKNLVSNVLDVFRYLSEGFVSMRVVDPANTNNIISDTLTLAEKAAIKSAAIAALKAPNWSDIVK